MSDQNAQKKSRQQFKGTDVTNLALETNSGNYYLLAKVNGASRRVSLKTKDLATAKRRFEARMAEIRHTAAKKTGLNTDAEFMPPAMFRMFAMKTMPELVKQLARLNRNLERANARGE